MLYTQIFGMRTWLQRSLLYMATIKAPFHVQEMYLKNMVVLVIMVKHYTI